MILAEIAIQQLTGNGIFDKVKEAKEKWKNAKDKEEIILSDYETNPYLNNAREYLNVKSGNYTGNGNFGNENPCILTFDEVPQMIIVSSVSPDVSNYTYSAVFLQGCNQ